MTGAREHLRALAAGEDGATLVLVVVALPVLILMCTFVVDVGNWFAHKRHLQTQADASALAAAGDYRFTCDETKIKATAAKYGGTAAGGYNQQIGGTASTNVNLLVNSPEYYNQGSNAADGSPCADRAIDVKLTETDLPLFFKVAGLFTKVPFINAHARVEFRQQERQVIGPFALEDSNPQAAKATFINEDETDASKRELGSVALTRNGSENGLAIWDNQANPIALPVTAERIGVRIALSGDSSTACDSYLTECYDSDSENGIVYLNGYSLAGTGQPPQPPLARSVTLIPGTCPNPYFAYTTTACKVGLQATLDFGPCKDILPIDTVGAVITARVDGKDYQLQYIGCPLGGTTSEWRTSGSPIPVDPAAGPLPVTLRWEETKGRVGNDRCKATGNKCTGTWGVVQRVFGADPGRSGPVRAAQLLAGGSPGANSLERCSDVKPVCTQSLVVKVGLEPSLAENAQDSNSPPVKLRVNKKSTAKNKTRSVDCDPNANLETELASGCAPKYERNRDVACPNRDVLWGSAQPWQCVAIARGNQDKQVFDGMNRRVHGTAINPPCDPGRNRWSSFPALDPRDPRFVTVILVPFGALNLRGTKNDDEDTGWDPSKSKTVPVTDFASFYVTGWAGKKNEQSSSICPDDNTADPSTIVGHFVKYVQTINDGSAGSQACNFNQLGNCVAVLAG